MTEAASYRRQVHCWLRLLATGRAAPEQAAPWAARLIAEDIEADEVTWQGLELLAGADLLTGPETLLHGQGDFAAWLADFEEATGADGRWSLPTLARGARESDSILADECTHLPLDISDVETDDLGTRISARKFPICHLSGPCV